MRYLVTRIEAPLLSAGEGDHWDIRGTGAFITKSQMIGLLAAGLGLSREESEQIARLSRGLSIACREDKKAGFMRDFQTVLNTVTAEGKIKKSLISPRHYLSDVAFTVLIGLKEPELEGEVMRALTEPVHPPYLGRKCCIPSAPLYRSEEPLEAAGDYEAFHLVEPLHRKEPGVRQSYPCVGEESRRGRKSYFHDSVVSFNPATYRRREVYIYTVEI